MREVNGVYFNTCYRSGPCLFGEQKVVPKEAFWDYYDRESKSFVFIKCRLHQKYFMPTLLQIEESDKYHSGIATESYETPDLQLADTNGVWMTRSDDPDCYRHRPWDEAKNCSICDMVCDIRDDTRYLNDDGSCPYNDSTPELIYWKVDDQAKPCNDFLHPLMLDNIEAINRKRRRAAKKHIWQYISQPKWMHALINSGQRIIDVWQRNYQPVTFYFRSFETIVLYLKTAPKAVQQKKALLKHLRKNLESSPSFEELLQGANAEYERRMLEKVDRFIEDGKWS